MKNKIRNITIIVVLGILISLRLNVACTGLQTKKPAEVPVADIDIPSQYFGIVPSDSIADVHVILHVDAGTFAEARRNAEDYKHFTVTKGAWTSRGDTLLLTVDDGVPYTTFLAQGDDLKMLDRPLENREESASVLYDLSKVHEFDSVSEHYQKMQSSGVQFFSSGNEPFWSFRVTGEVEGEFSTPESTIKTDVTWEAADDDSDKTTGYFISDERELSVRIDNVFCQDTMSGILFTHQVYINFSNKEFVGCGTYL